MFLYPKLTDMAKKLLFWMWWLYRVKVYLFSSHVDLVPCVFSTLWLTDEPHIWTCVYPLLSLLFNFATLCCYPSVHTFLSSLFEYLLCSTILCEPFQFGRFPVQFWTDSSSFLPTSVWFLPNLAFGSFSLELLQYNLALTDPARENVFSPSTGGSGKASTRFGTDALQLDTWCPNIAQATATADAAV